MLSSEDIVVKIQCGDQGYMGELWERVADLVKWKANRTMTALELRGNPCGVEFDDLYQSGYLAMVEAVDSYRQENGAFSTWFMFHLKNAFSKATGYRTQKAQNEPLNNSLSFDSPLTDDSDGGTLGDVVPDCKAATTLESVEDKLWLDQLRNALDNALCELPDDESTVLKKRYYDCQTLVNTGVQMGITGEDARKLEKKGLNTLRQYKYAKKLRPFYDFDYYSGTSLAAFQNTGMSVQERYLIRKEKGA